ncbi:27569_t:CDS:2, partial [Racocetra persica]
TRQFGVTDQPKAVNSHNYRRKSFFGKADTYHNDDNPNRHQK